MTSTTSRSVAFSVAGTFRVICNSPTIFDPTQRVSVSNTSTRYDIIKTYVHLYIAGKTVQWFDHYFSFLLHYQLTYELLASLLRQILRISPQNSRQTCHQRVDSGCPWANRTSRVPGRAPHRSHIRDVASNLLRGFVKSLQQRLITNHPFFGRIHHVNHYLGSTPEHFKFLFSYFLFFGHVLDLLQALSELRVSIFKFLCHTLYVICATV
jgi:hypothetical protein